jgi:NAD(P)H dehydrogenase (quinone)
MMDRPAGPDGWRDPTPPRGPANQRLFHMKVSIILGHPTPGSFNHAIAQAAAETLRSRGHDVRLHDLYAERFDPIFTSAETARDAVLPPAIARHCTELDEADGLIVIHPNYWSSPPAIVRGWVDRVLRAGRAYTFVPDGQGGATPEGLLKAAAALVFTTANTPHDVEVARFGDPLATHWLTVVFGLCGIRHTQKWDFSPVMTSTPDTRSQWLDEVRGAMMQYFP